MYKVAFIIPGESGFSYNGKRFDTVADAEAHGRDIMSRWFIPSGFEVVKADD